MRELLSKGKIPFVADLESLENKDDGPDKDEKTEKMMEARPFLMGSVAGAVSEVLPAAFIVREMVSTAISVLKNNSILIKPKL